MIQEKDPAKAAFEVVRLLLANKPLEAKQILDLEAEKMRERCNAYLERRFPRFPNLD